MTERVQPSPEPVASSLAEGKTAEWWMNKTMYWKEQFDAVVRQRDHALKAEWVLAALRGASPRPSDQNSNSPHSAPSNGLSTGEVSGLRQNSNAGASPVRESEELTVDDALQSRRLGPVREERERIAVERCAKVMLVAAREILALDPKSLYAKQLMDDQRLLRDMALRAPESAPPRDLEQRMHTKALEIQIKNAHLSLDRLGAPRKMFKGRRTLTLAGRIERLPERGDRNASPPINVRSTERELTDDVR